MMSGVNALLRFAAPGLGVLLAGSVVNASIISFKAVKKNDVAITPTNNLAVLGNDKIEIEMFLSNWINDFPDDATPNKVRIFQVTIDRAGYVSNDNGTAKPLGWCGPVDKIQCSAAADCPPEYPVCRTSPPTGCTCTPHTPELGCFIDNFRPDFLFFGPEGPNFEVATTEIGFKYFGISENANQAVTDTGVARYLGTLIVKVSANACGTFTIGHVQKITSTYIADPASPPNRVLPSLQPLTLTVSDCVRQLLSCSPGHCNIDARIAHDRLDEFAGRNPFQIVMTFSKTVVGSCSNAPASPCTLNNQCPGGTCTGRLDLEVTELPFDPDDPIPPGISWITAGGDPKIATINFAPRIQRARWTCFRDRGSNKRCCMGSLPGDADNSRVSEPDDVFELLDNLNGGVNPPLAIEKCDIDRSVRCSPADLLMAVDVLTGADAFPEFYKDTLPQCPPMAPDP